MYGSRRDAFSKLVRNSASSTNLLFASTAENDSTYDFVPDLGAELRVRDRIRACGIFRPVQVAFLRVWASFSQFLRGHIQREKRDRSISTHRTRSERLNLSLRSIFERVNTLSVWRLVPSFFLLVLLHCTDRVGGCRGSMLDANPASQVQSGLGLSCHLEATEARPSYSPLMLVARTGIERSLHLECLLPVSPVMV